MLNKIYYLFVISTILACQLKAQTDTGWHHKNCAVSLTYDDALNVDLDNVIPALDSLGLKATFYLSGYSGVLNARMPEWRAIAKNGHELGNHTLFHPCTGKLPGREFVNADYDLSNYSLRRITDEIMMTNTLLKAIDGQTKRTFAYPCGDTQIGDTFYLDKLKNDFTAARGTKQEMLQVDKTDLFNIGCYAINGQQADELIDLVKKAMSSHSLLVFLFHGVGGGHSLNVSLDAHSKLLHFLKQNEKNIWIEPMIGIAEYLKQNQVR